MTDQLLKEILGEVKSLKQEMGKVRLELTEVKQEVASFRHNLDEIKCDLQQFENRMDQGFAATAAELNTINVKLEQSFDGVVAMIDITQDHVIEIQKNLSAALYNQEAHDEQLEMHNESINLLSTKIPQHEDEIELLKKKSGIPA